MDKQNQKVKVSDDKNTSNKWKVLSFKNFIKFKQDHDRSRREYEKKI